MKVGLTTESCFGLSINFEPFVERITVYFCIGGTFRQFFMTSQLRAHNVSELYYPYVNVWPDCSCFLFNVIDFKLLFPALVRVGAGVVFHLLIAEVVFD